VLRIVARDELCRRCLEIPEVAPVTALTFVTAIDDPARFRRSRDVAAYFGLTSRRRQSGSSIDIQGRTLDELPPQTRSLLLTIHEWAAEECVRASVRRCDLRFSRRQMRVVTGWGDTQLKVHLSRLAELEYLLVHRVKAGHGYEYELLYDGEGEARERFVMGLSEPVHLARHEHGYDARRSGEMTSRSVSGRGVDGGRSAGSRSPESAAKPQPASASDDDGADQITQYAYDASFRVTSIATGFGTGDAATEAHAV